MPKFAPILSSRAVLLEHDPEKWIPVSRLREAHRQSRLFFRQDASAGEGRSEEIMLKKRNGYSTRAISLYVLTCVRKISPVQALRCRCAREGFNVIRPVFDPKA
jgi:hypothetical protein